MVQGERLNSRSPFCCPTLDNCPIFQPLKVITPIVEARIEQGDTFPCFGIASHQPIGFVAIAHRASQNEITLFVGPALGLWNNVVDFKQGTDDPLRGQAVIREAQIGLSR